MSKTVYDTRFFVEFFYSKDQETRGRIEKEKRRREKFTSAIVIHELFQLTLIHEGRETAKLRVALLKKSFEIIPVDEHVAEVSAELRHKYKLSMGDSMIAATASILGAVCFSDDPHFEKIREIKAEWLK